MGAEAGDALTVAAVAAVEPPNGVGGAEPIDRAARPSRWLVRILGACAGVVVLLICVLASIAYGSVEIELGTVLGAFTEFNGSTEHIVVQDIRLPRTLIGVCVGASLAVAGAVMQAVTRNVLADPGILGVNAGASLAVVLAIFVLGITSVYAYVWFGFIGAALAAVVVYGLGSSGRGGPTPIRITLAGAVLAALLTSFTSGILVLDARSLDVFRFWAVGSLAGREMGVIAVLAPFMIVGLVIALTAGRALNALALGDDVARALGQRVMLVRGLAALSVVILSGSAVAAAGPIGFVGLAVPHAARLVVGPDWRWILCYSALFGPILLLAADVIGRIVVRPAELQVGIVTAVVGTPIFVYLARRRDLAAL